MTVKERRRGIVFLVLSVALQVAGICAADARLHVPGVVLMAVTAFVLWRETGVGEG